MFFSIGNVRATPLTLEDILDLALKSYPAVLSSLASQEAAGNDLLGAKLKFLPAPAFNTWRNSVQYMGQSQTGNLPATTVSLTQPILGGGLVAQYDKYDARNSAAMHQLNETRDEVAVRVIAAYADWVRSYLKTIALQEQVQLHEKLVGQVTRRYEAGVTAGVDRDLAISRLNLASAELESQTSAEKTALSVLSKFAGVSISRENMSTNIPRGVPLPSRGDVIFRTISVNARLQRLKFETEAMEAESSEVLSQSLPSVSLQAVHQVGNAYVPGYPGYNSVGLVLQYSPPGGFSGIASTRAAAGRAKASKFQMETAKEELIESVNSDYNNLESSKSKIAQLNSASSLSNDISKSFDRQFLVGKKSWLELMNALREKVQVQSALADAKALYLTSNYRLLVYTRALDDSSSINPMK